MAFRLAISSRPKEEFFFYNCGQTGSATHQVSPAAKLALPLTQSHLQPNWLCHSPSLTCSLLERIKRKKISWEVNLNVIWILFRCSNMHSLASSAPYVVTTWCFSPEWSWPTFQSMQWCLGSLSPQVLYLAVTPLDSDFQCRIPTALPALIGICIRESPLCLS